MAVDWRTPRGFYKLFDDLLHFQIDAAADTTNHLCPLWYGPGSSLTEDALSVEKWISPAWVNPPYGGSMWKRWLEKFNEQGQLGVNVVALIPAAVGARWWSDYVVKTRNDVVFVTGRVPFTSPSHTKPTQPNHDSALVFFGPSTALNVGWVDWRDHVTQRTREQANAEHAGDRRELVDGVEGHHSQQTAQQPALSPHDAGPAVRLRPALRRLA